MLSNNSLCCDPPNFSLLSTFNKVFCYNDKRHKVSSHTASFPIHRTLHFPSNRQIQYKWAQSSTIHPFLFSAGVDSWIRSWLWDKVSYSQLPYTCISLNTVSVIMMWKNIPFCTPHSIKLANSSVVKVQSFRFMRHSLRNWEHSASSSPESSKMIHRGTNQSGYPKWN